MAYLSVPFTSVYALLHLIIEAPLAKLCWKSRWRILWTLRFVQLAMMSLSGLQMHGPTKRYSRVTSGFPCSSSRWMAVGEGILANVVRFSNKIADFMAIPAIVSNSMSIWWIDRFILPTHEPAPGIGLASWFFLPNFAATWCVFDLSSFLSANPGLTFQLGENICICSKFSGSNSPVGMSVCILHKI